MTISRDKNRKVAFIYDNKGLSTERITMLGKRFDARATLYITQQKETAALDSSNSRFDSLQIVDSSNVNRFLGQEFENIIFDATEVFDVNGFASISGCLVGGGSLILILREDLRELDEQYQFLLDQTNKNNDTSLSACLLRILQKVENSDCLESKENFFRTKASSKLNCSKNLPHLSAEFLSEQQVLISKIKRVSLGHAKRPLVVIADRGRGKSAALGIASAELVSIEHKKVVITAPSRANLKVFFKHFNRRLEELNASHDNAVSDINVAKNNLVFISPDNLVISPDIKNLIVIEEAGALPNQVLSKIITKSNRLVFSTTVAGYEGNGRGFEVRFLPKLYDTFPQARVFKAYQPIRFRKDDLLEGIINEALLLNPFLPELSTAKGLNMEFREVSQLELLGDENLLSQVFSILVTAHYQTRPSDLERILSDRNLKIFIASEYEFIFSVALTIAEGELNENVCDQIDKGLLRLKGHLIPQSMIANQGIVGAGPLKSWRVMRIATAPEFRRKGIASQLLQEVNKLARGNGVQLITASFSLEENNVEFWYKQNFKCIRFGFRKDSSTGNHSGEFIYLNKARESTAKRIYDQAINQFNLAFYRQLTSSFKRLDSCVVDLCIRKQIASKSAIHDYQLAEVKRFAEGARSYEMVEWHLYNFVKEVYFKLSKAIEMIPKNDRSCIIQKILQQNNWQFITDNFSNTGQKQSIKQIRTTIHSLLDCVESRKLH